MRIERVIEAFHSLRRICPACERTIRPGQLTVLHQGQRHHKGCVRYMRR